MSTSSPWTFVIGFTAQLLFAARMIVQWIRSEKAGKPISPIIFWQISVIGSLVFLVYGILRHDFAIVLGQILVYFIYIRNLYLQERWRTIPIIFRTFIFIAPILTLGYLLFGTSGNIFLLLINKEISTPLKMWGSAGQIIFTLRFYIQWIDSESKSESVLTRRFWLVSVVGSLMIITYAILRYDPVLLIGQFAGLVIYIRNIELGRSKKVSQ